MAGLFPFAVSPAAGAAKRAPTVAQRTYVSADIVRTTRLAVLRSRTFRLRLRARGPTRVRLQVVIREGSAAARRHGGVALTPLRTFVFVRAGTRVVTLPLTTRGYRALRNCGIVRILVRSYARRLAVGARGRRLRQLGAVRVRKAGTTFPRVRRDCVGGQVFVSGGVGSGQGAGRGPGTVYSVGTASRSINPGPDGKYAGGNVALGGYGISGTKPFGGRFATGILGDGSQVRAIAFSDRRHGAAIADIEVQGWFVANNDGPLGLVDMRKAVERRTGGALKASDVVVQSDHTHSGPDPMGVWGGVPLAYRQFMFNQTVDAIVEAYARRRPATLFYGTAPGRDLLSNQFDYDPPNQVVDSDVRVLQAVGDDDRTLATLLNFSAHATVLGSSNTKVSGDWVQAANPLLKRRFGGDAMTVVGTLGRTQPNDGPSDTACKNAGLTGDAHSLCAINDYGGKVVDRAAQAVGASTPIGGSPMVGTRSYLIEDVTSNAILLGLVYAGGAVDAPLNRSQTPPWLAGNVLGTVTGSVRIGDVLLSVIPGEAYPQIALKVRQLAPGYRGYMTAALADDQLGYLIAPYEAYPEPIRRSFFTQRGDEVSPIDNDNYFFNASHTMGERVTCSLLRGAGELMGKGNAYRDAHDRCVAFPNDLVLGPGADAG